jgi:hypothetical protein
LHSPLPLTQLRAPPGQAPTAHPTQPAAGTCPAQPQPPAPGPRQRASRVPGQLVRRAPRAPRALRPPAQPRSCCGRPAPRLHAGGPPRGRRATDQHHGQPCVHRRRRPAHNAPARYRADGSRPTEDTERGVRVCLVTGYGYVLAAAVLALCYASAANLLAKRHAQSKASHVQVFSRGKDGGNEHAPRGHADETPPACGGTSGAFGAAVEFVDIQRALGPAHRQHPRPAHQAGPARWTSAPRSTTPACMATASRPQPVRPHLPSHPTARPSSLLTPNAC